MSTLLALLACGSPPPAEPPAPVARVSTLQFLEWPEDPSLELPVVISIHGHQGRAQRMVDLVRDCDVEARVLAPFAPDGRSWYRLGEPDTVAAAAAELEALMVDVSRMRRYPGKQIVTGFSQGGAMAWVVAVQRPDLVGAALPMSGGLPPALEPHPLPAGLPIVRAYQPEFDEALTPQQMRRLGVDQFLAAGADAQLVVVAGAHHQLRDPMRAAFCEGLREVAAKQVAGG